MGLENASALIDKEESVTIGDIIALLRQHLLKIVSATIGATAVAVFYSYTVPETWVATIHVVPTEVPHSEQLGALAEVLSKKAGSGSANIDLFTALLTSRPVLEKLIVSQVVKPAPNGNALKSVQSELEIDTNDIKSRFFAVEKLAKTINFSQQQSSLSNIVEVNLTAKSEWLAKGMLSNLMGLGQSALYEVTKSRYQTSIPRLEQADSVAFAKAQRVSEEIVQFQENNRNSEFPSVRQKLDRYRQELQVRDQTYLMVRKELEQDRLEMEKITPPVVAIDSVSVPPFREGPKRARIVIIGLVLGLIGSSGLCIINGIVLGRKV
jgi:uncharacterized protein involved in exopolysaccharide biosynthesis